MISLRRDELESLHYMDVLGMLGPSSPYGREHVRTPRFFAPEERETLEREWQNVEKGILALRNHADAVERLRHCFTQLRDIRSTLLRIHSETLDEIELFEVKRYLLQLALIAPVYRQTGADFSGIEITEEAEALSLLDPDGMRLPAYSVHAAPNSPLREARNQKAALEAALRESVGEEARRRLLEERLFWVTREEEETRRERRRLTESLRLYAPALLKNAEAIGKIDFLLEKARIAAERGCAKPAIVKEGVRLFEMVNPRMDDAQAADRHDGFTPLTVFAPEGATVITGANMGGKSIAIRTLALNVLLCHAGFYAFSARAELSLFDSLHLIMEDFANEERGVSGFAAEMMRISGLLTDIARGNHCFSIIDEPARGTNPEEGAALVKALVKKICNRRSVCVVTTHFEGVSGMATARYRTAGFQNLPDSLPAGAGVRWFAKHMRYGLIPDDGTPPPRHALTVCRLLGLDREVLEEMKRLLFCDKNGEENCYD